ncbi:MAG: GNAT family N-acetyltransferase [Firmicutes bacterium]|nr:GNAT family N-acetyltransferase [Bacillota bacterium]
MNLKPFHENDLQNLRELQPEGWPDIVPPFVNYLRRPYCTPLKVILENKLVGVGAGISWGKTAWLAHIVVAPDHRNQGIGGFIVRQLLYILKNSGCETVSLIATEMGYPVYQKVGFIEETEYVFFERETPLKTEYQSDNILRMLPEDQVELLSLDKKISGEDRSALLAEEINNCYFYRENGRILGCYLPGLGEGLIIAENPKAGIELMKFKYSISNKGSLPIDNKEGIAFLKANGFLETKKTKRMIWGKEFSWRPEKIYARIGGNLG